MRELSTLVSPMIHDGLVPYRVQFSREGSGAVPSMLDEGVIYRHPETREDAVVWASDPSEVARVLTYHFGQSWFDLRVVGVEQRLLK